MKTIEEQMRPYFEKVARENAERDERAKAREAEDAKRGTFIMDHTEGVWLDRHKLTVKLSADDVAKLNEACKRNWIVINR